MRRMPTGFTLTEMLVTISIMGILLAVAVPSYLSTISSTRMSNEINTLLGSLNFARSEAGKRGLRVDVCPQAGATCGSGTNWTSGWYVLLDSTSAQLQISPALTHGDVLTSTVAAYPYFTPAGYTFFTGTISLHDSSNTLSLRRCIIFSAGAYNTATGASCP